MKVMRRHIANFFSIILISIFYGHLAIAMECIAASDFGQGGTFYILANPDEGNSGPTKLVFDTPQKNQVAPWIPTNFTTMGQSANSGVSNDSESALKVYVSGAWAPWGGDVTSITTICQLQACDPTNSDQSACLDQGQHVYVSPTGDNIPCILNQGWGLYGLIAIDYNSVRKDPNDPTYAKNLPSQYFRTFRVSPLQHDADGDFFEMTSTQQCDLDATTGQTICKTDQDSNGRDVMLKGSLYFKILDGYYQDNTGQYVVSVVSGVSSAPGFIQTTVQYFSDVMKQITEAMYNNLTSQTGFITIGRAVVLLYITISGFLFMMGMLNIHIAELVVRLVKASFVLILISSTSWDFFNTYLFSFFTDGAQSIASMITQAAFTYSSQYGMGQFILPENVTAVSVFDNVVQMFINPSSAVHKKIIAMIFYKYYIFYVIFIYVCIGILILAIIRSVMLYVTSIMLVTMLLVMSPIFIMMILFSLTKEIFDTWLKQLMVNALMLIVISASMALMINLILNQLEQLLYYQVCWEIVWSFQIGSWDLFDVWFWNPTDSSQLEKCLTPANFFGYLLVCLLFNAFMEQIPELIDGLATSSLMPLSQMTAGINRAFESTKVYQGLSSGINQIRSRVSLTTPMLRTEGGQRLLAIANQKFNKNTDKFDRIMAGDPYWKPNTSVARGLTDAVGNKIDKTYEKLTPKNRGIIDPRQ